MNSMPSLEDMRGLDGGDGSFRCIVNPVMFRVQTAALLGAYFLTSIRASTDAVSRERRVNIAMQGAEVAYALGDVGLIYPQVTIGVRRLFILFAKRLPNWLTSNL